jgi:hypothetical protein
MRLRRFACAAVLVASVFSSTSALAAETAEYCSETDMTCETAPIAFSKEIVLPVQGGFDTGWVPQGSPLQVHLWAQLWANSYVDLAGRLETTWPDALTLDAIPDPGGGELGIHYGVDIGAQAHVEVTVLGQTFDWTGDIPYVPQFDFQVEASNTFDPWGFEGISVEGSTMEATIAQISATDFIGVNIPGLDGGFELNTYIELTATYRTTKIDVVRMPNEDAVTGGAIDAEGETTSDDYAGEHGIDYGVRPVGEVIYDGVLHLIPAFYIETIGPDFSIPIADIPIPFEFIQKDWEFDFAEVHVPLPDVELNQEGRRRRRRGRPRARPRRARGGGVCFGQRGDRERRRGGPRRRGDARLGQRLDGWVQPVGADVLGGAGRRGPARRHVRRDRAGDVHGDRHPREQRPGRAVAHPRGARPRAGARGSRR